MLTNSTPFLSDRVQYINNSNLFLFVCYIGQVTTDKILFVKQMIPILDLKSCVLFHISLLPQLCYHFDEYLIKFCDIKLNFVIL